MANFLTAVKPVLETVEGTKFQTRKVWVPEAGKPYQAFSKSRKHFSALTHAAFLASGMITQSSAKAAPVASDGDFALWAMIVGKTARNYWSAERVKDGRISVKGLNTLSERIAGGGRGYATDMDTVAQVYAALTKGGEIDVNGAKVKFVAPIVHRVKVAAKAPTKAKAKAKAKPTLITPKAK